MARKRLAPGEATERLAAERDGASTGSAFEPTEKGPTDSASRRGYRAIIYLRVSTINQVNVDIDDEGFSIPAQREFCQHKANEIGAEVVEEYVDKGESARSADRPALQALLARIRERKDVHFLIVHKVDRLARSLQDSVTIQTMLTKHDVMLVSAAEHIDETPAGQLMHGMLASFAQYYSANLASEARK